MFRDGLNTDAGMAQDNRSSRIFQYPVVSYVHKHVALRREFGVVVKEVLFTSSVAKHAFRMICNDEVSLNRASIMGYEVETLHSDQLEHVEELFSSTLVMVIARILPGLPIPFQIRRDAAICLGEHSHLLIPLVP